MFKHNVNATVAILLYEFATGTGLDTRVFTPQHAMTKKLMQSNAVEEAVHEFYMKNRYKQITELKTINYEFKFSPHSKIEELGNLPKSIKEHLNAAREIMVDKEWSTLFLGGVRIEVIPANGKELHIIIKNKSDKESLMLHMAKSTPREPGKTIVLGTINQEFRFTLPLDTNRLITEDDTSIKTGIKDYIRWFYEELIRKTLR